MREVIAKSQLQPILTKGRSTIEIETQEIIQSILDEYEKAKQVTQERMYLETMEKVLADIDKVIIDRKAGGVVPYLPLPELSKKKGSDTQ